MFVMFVFVLFPVLSTAEELNTGIYINQNETCVLSLVNKINSTLHGQMTSAGFDFSNVEWTTNANGKKRGYLNSTYAGNFVRDVKISLKAHANETPPIRPLIIAYCLYDGEMPELIEEAPDMAISLTTKPLQGTQPRSNRPDTRKGNDDTSNESMESFECVETTSCNMGPWTWCAIGAGVTANLFCIGILVYMMLHYRKIVKEFKSKEIPAHITDRPPLDLPPEIQYDVVYSHRVDRFVARQPRYHSIRDFLQNTATKQ